MKQKAKSNKYEINKRLNDDSCIYYLGDIGDYNRNTNELLNIIKKEIKFNDIIIFLGDNFYPAGVKSIDDKKWNLYENSFGLLKNQCYALLGNHDYILNPKAQIEYNRTNWNIKNWYYNIEFNNINLIFLDTVILAPNSSPNFDSKHIEKKHGKKCELLIKDQINWFNDICQRSKKKIIVHGHYPIITNGQYKNCCNELQNILLPLFKKYNITQYICGHEHNIQYINHYYDNHLINNIICGTGASTRNIKIKKNTDFFSNEICFIRYDSKTFNFINNKNKIIFKI